MTDVIIYRNDVLKSIYFILSMAQAQKGSAMHGALTSKGDLIGGIFDRWINIVPESIIFNKVLFPTITQGEKVEIVSDFYHYDPKEAGIAPDVLGIKVNNKIVPFVEFDNKWKPVKGMPQIEIKTFKKPQKMISLRNQEYDDKYLVMAETDLRIDYLIPFFNLDVVSDEIYSSLVMDNDVFVKSNEKNVLTHFPKLDLTDSSLGSINLLKITKAKEFMDISTHCEEGVSVQYIYNIGISPKTKRSFDKVEKLSDYCDFNSQTKLFSFNEHWYDGLENAIPFIYKGNNKFFQRTLDFYTSDIDAITVTKRNKSTLYVEVIRQCVLNEFNLLPGERYKISFATLERSDSPRDEFFMQKSLIPYIPCFRRELMDTLKNIIDKNKE